MWSPRTPICRTPQIRDIWPRSLTVGRSTESVNTTVDTFPSLGIGSHIPRRCLGLRERFRAVCAARSMSRTVRAATALGVAAQPPTRACGVHTTATAKAPTVGLRLGRFLRAMSLKETRPESRSTPRSNAEWSRDPSPWAPSAVTSCKSMAHRGRCIPRRPRPKTATSYQHIC